MEFLGLLDVAGPLLQLPDVYEYLDLRGIFSSTYRVIFCVKSKEGNLDCEQRINR